MIGRAAQVADDLRKVGNELLTSAVFSKRSEYGGTSKHSGNW
jgi:hypothetical protein